MEILGFITLVITGFTSCAEFGSYAFVHPVIRQLPPEHHIRVEQGLLKTFGRVMPVLAIPHSSLPSPSSQGNRDSAERLVVGPIRKGASRRGRSGTPGFRSGPRERFSAPLHLFLIRAFLAAGGKTVKKNRCWITLSAQSEVCERVFPGTPIQADLPRSRRLHS